MSVTKNFRSITKLKVVTDAIELCSYTMDTCGKEENFPKRSRWMLAEKIVNLSQEIVDYLIKGNEIQVETTEDFLKRRGYQRDAYGACESMLVFMMIAYMKYQLDDNTIDFWTGNVIEVEKKIMSWRRRDINRYIRLVPPDLIPDDVDNIIKDESDDTDDGVKDDLPF